MKLKFFYLLVCLLSVKLKKQYLHLNLVEPDLKIFIFYIVIQIIPVLSKDLNLNNMLTLKKKLNCKIGFSDHSIGNLASIVASSLGAEVIEKHVTLNNNLNLLTQIIHQA